MTRKEKDALNYACARIRDLAGMKNAHFGMTEDYDKTIKTGVRPYMVWFECVAMYIEALANAEDKFDLQNAMDDIFRHCN